MVVQAGEQLTKDQVLQLLGGVQLGFLYGYFVEAVARKCCRDIAAEAISGGAFAFEGNWSHSRPLRPLGELLGDSITERAVRGNMFLMLKHQLVKMSYELAHEYCQRSGQADVYSAAEWMQFARVWRNVLSHGDAAVLTQWPPNLTRRGVTVVRWRDKQLSASSVGHAVDDLDVTDALRLVDDIREFVEGLS